MRTAVNTAVKQYAAILGVDPKSCLPTVYHLPHDQRDDQIGPLIEANAPAKIGSDALRNLKNNIRFLLGRAVALGLLPPLPPPQVPLASFQKRSRIPAHSIRQGEDMPYGRYGLWPLPPALAREYEAFRTWSMQPYVPDRPAHLKKRAVTMMIYEKTLRRVAGFATSPASPQLLDPQAITMRDLTDPTLVDAFTTWWVNRRTLVTRGIEMHLTCLEVIARYWLKDRDRADRLRQIKRCLPAAKAVRKKEKRWLELWQLEAIGVSQYPFNARRLQESSWMHQKHDYLNRPADSPRIPGWERHPLTRTAYAVEASLILRLLIRLPYRQRNIREMCLQENLRPCPDGTWEIIFRGDELKIDQRNGQENVLPFDFPADLQDLLQEWLTLWRPRLASPSETHVFLNVRGKPFTENQIRDMIKHTTWRFSAQVNYGRHVAVTPHMIRDIFATTLVREKKELVSAAKMLGNTVGVVAKHYAHLLEKDTQRELTPWIKEQLVRPPDLSSEHCPKKIL